MRSKYDVDVRRSPRIRRRRPQERRRLQSHRPLADVRADLERSPMRSPRVADRPCEFASSQRAITPAAKPNSTASQGPTCNRIADLTVALRYGWRPTRRQAVGPDIARCRRRRAAGAEDAGASAIPARSIRSPRAARPAHRPRDAARRVPERPTRRSTSRTSGSGVDDRRPMTRRAAERARRERGTRRRCGVDATPSRSTRALADFLGTFPQLPPPFSAKKVGGVQAYKKARKNEPWS